MATGDRTEHVLVGDRTGQIRFDLRSGTVLRGAVQLRCDLVGSAGVEAKLLTLSRLMTVIRLKRFPDSFAQPVRRAPRWLMALRALDGRRSGASHRDIAVALFGPKCVEADWADRSDYLRCRVQRLLRLGEMMTKGGYRRLLL